MMRTPDIKLFSESNQEVVISEDEDESLTRVLSVLSYPNPSRMYQERSMNEYNIMDNKKANAEIEDESAAKVNTLNFL